jgi:enterochelin esterase-like enzyme
LPAEPWEDTDVAHGIVHRHLYSSTVTGDERDYYVDTPPGFDPKAKTKYPVLFLVRGFSGYTNEWTAMGHANLILDNLSAQGKSKAMIVVMPSGYGAPKILDLGWGQPLPEKYRLNRDNFTAVLLEEIIPRIEKEYPVGKDREHRAIAGFSMGGALSLYVGLNHIDQFAWIAAMSAGILKDPDSIFPRLSTKEANKLRLLWIACPPAFPAADLPLY